MIEKQNSMSIKIFKNKDEKFFRHEEFKLITSLSKQNQIISTGGGLFCNNDIIKFINKNGISIYLKYSSEVFMKD